MNRKIIAEEYLAKIQKINNLKPFDTIKKQRMRRINLLLFAIWFLSAAGGALGMMLYLGML